MWVQWPKPFVICYYRNGNKLWFHCTRQNCKNPGRKQKETRIRLNGIECDLSLCEGMWIILVWVWRISVTGTSNEALIKSIYAYLWVRLKPKIVALSCFWLLPLPNEKAICARRDATPAFIKCNGHRPIT